MQLSSTPLISEVEALDSHDPVILALQCAWIDEGPARDVAIAKLSESLDGNEDLCRKLVGDACAAYMLWHWAENLQAMLDNGERVRIRISENCWARHSVTRMRNDRNRHERDARALVAHMVAMAESSQRGTGGEG